MEVNGNNQIPGQTSGKPLDQPIDCKQLSVIPGMTTASVPQINDTSLLPEENLAPIRPGIPVQYQKTLQTSSQALKFNTQDKLDLRNQIQNMRGENTQGLISGAQSNLRLQSKTTTFRSSIDNFGGLSNILKAKYGDRLSRAAMAN